MPNSSLLIASDGAITTLTLNRPDKLNALNAELLGELTSAFRALGSGSARVVIVTGAGGKAFSAGVDIGEMSSMTVVEAKARADQGHALAELIEALHCPVIAAVPGFALGGGCELALACDFIHASRQGQVRPTGGEPRRHSRVRRNAAARATCRHRQSPRAHLHGRDHHRPARSRDRARQRGGPQRRAPPRECGRSPIKSPKRGRWPSRKRNEPCFAASRVI